MKIHSGEEALETVDFNVLGAEGSVHSSSTGAGYDDKVFLSGGSPIRYVIL